MNPFGSLLQAVRAEQAACLVRIARSDGSAPRDVDAWMVVRPSGQFHGSIGGGALEFNAIAQARKLLADGRTALETQNVALGPGLGQCCGGRVMLHYENFSQNDLASLELLSVQAPVCLIASVDSDGRVARRPQRAGEMPVDGAWREHYATQPTSLLLFGAGHVARALVVALAPLPFAVRWIETRANAFPDLAPANVQCIETAVPQAEIASAPAGSFALVMTHSHALDLEICASALRSKDIVYTGVIGSLTKRARFLSQLAQAGLDEQRMAALVCPIGLPGLAGKEPAVIAASVAADLLMRRKRENGDGR